MLRTGRIEPIRLGYARIIPAILLLAWTPLQAQSAQKPVTSVEAVRQLSAAEAAKGLPVDVTGVVTYSNPAQNDLFIQDGDGWVYVEPDKKYAIAPGSRVEVKGTTGASYSTEIVATSIQVTGTAPLPQPVSLSYEEAVNRANDCRYVTMQGIVRAASYQTTVGSALYLLRMDDGARMIDVVVLDYPEFSPSRLLDATVRVTGALG